MATRSVRKNPGPKTPRDRRQGENRLPARAEGARNPWLWIALLFLLHISGLALLFDPVSGLLSRQPVIEQDWGLHFHHLKSMEGFWRGGQRLWGYNPLFMAGYPSNTIQDLSVKLFELLALWLSALGLDATQAFKLTVFLATAAVPWMIFFAARNFFEDETLQPIVPPLAALLATAYWWNSLPREMFFYGMIGFPLAAYFSILALSFIYRMAGSERAFTPAHWAWIVAAIVILPLHVQAVLILAPPAVALWIARGRAFSPTTLIWLGAGGAISLAANLIWLTPAFSHRGDDASSTIVAQLAVFVSSDPFSFLKDYLKPGGYWTFRATYWENGLRWALLVLGGCGAARLLKSERRDLGIMLTCGFLSLFLLAYFGSLIAPLKSLQPLRFKIAADLFLILASSYLIGVRRRVPSTDSRPAWTRLVLAGGLIAALVNVAQTESRAKMRLRTEISPAVAALVEWVREEAPKDGRLLFEESGDETGFVYQGSYLSSFLPHWTGRELVGGPINLYNDRHHFAEFHSGILFKRDIANFASAELAAYFRAYNIGAVIAFHPRSVERLISSGLVSVDRRLGPIHLLRVNQPLSWFLKGEGELESGLNRIRASKVKGDEIVLKYHWTEGLVSDPPVAISPEKILDDPIPFIKITNPPAEFTLSIGR